MCVLIRLGTFSLQFSSLISKCFSSSVIVRCDRFLAHAWCCAVFPIRADLFWFWESLLFTPCVDDTQIYGCLSFSYSLFTYCKWTFPFLFFDYVAKISGETTQKIQLSQVLRTTDNHLGTRRKCIGKTERIRYNRHFYRQKTRHSHYGQNKIHTKSKNNTTRNRLIRKSTKT